MCCTFRPLLHLGLFFIASWRVWTPFQRLIVVLKLDTAVSHTGNQEGRQPYILSELWKKHFLLKCSKVQLLKTSHVKAVLRDAMCLMLCWVKASYSWVTQRKRSHNDLWREITFTKISSGLKEIKQRYYLTEAEFPSHAESTSSRDGVAAPGSYTLLMAISWTWGPKDRLPPATFCSMRLQCYRNW